MLGRTGTLKIKMKTHEQATGTWGQDHLSGHVSYAVAQASLSEGTLPLVSCSAMAILKFLIISSVYLCFVSEVPKMDGTRA